VAKRTRRSVKAALLEAITKMCRQCIHDSLHGNGTWRYQTEMCTDDSCPLYHHRPLQIEEVD